ncbi:hypothetical protein LTS08_001565 [Lithohypha guttulata]|uniref:NADP-dependent oxidoreductase domain-containing protein n=1 Tax=Lithohypha guttulata TaxID=1690604 RepID=A0AAN7SVG7_9EURO|nr:hypothetical protein LTR51_003767 [Lithohypha guttulata]KAK5082272.1 hypothetical protein LTR05_007416 [Lithohypha guttulata]KAK5105288.1 hypothetical protein LTS08_001565 [Lithohypha guttulata]
MAQKILQTGLSAGMSAVSGFHSSKPHKISEDYDGLQHVLPDSFKPSLESRYTLRGRNGQDVHVPLISWGAWSWGDTSTFHWSDDELPALRQAWQRCIETGMTFVDTAQVYGSGKSEEILGDLINNHSSGIDRSKIFVQTKWLPNVTDQATNALHPVDAPVKELRNTLDRMRLQYVDSYMVHGPIHLSSIKQVAKGLAKCVEDGMTKAVGVANYSVDDMLKMKEALAEYGIPLATNQCEFSILRRLPETEGMLEACRKNDIVFQAYSSIAQGRLSGKYDIDNPPPKEYRFSSYDMKHVQPAIDELRLLGQKYGVSAASVAINWVICKGALPVVGMRKESQAQEDIAALGWRLTNEEIAKLDSLGFEGKTTKLWQQG